LKLEDKNALDRGLSLMTSWQNIGEARFDRRVLFGVYRIDLIGGWLPSS
jgi:hypothetical protein